MSWLGGSKDTEDGLQEWVKWANVRSVLTIEN